jgi:hypothetical protein
MSYKPDVCVCRKRAALKDYEQYTEVVKNIDRLIAMVTVTLDEQPQDKKS